MRELWRGNANAWECDELGHLNIRGYLAKAMEAFTVLGAQLGLNNPHDPAALSIVVPRLIHIRFLSEARPGAGLSISGGLTTHDANSLTAALLMRHHPGERPAAGLAVTADHVTPQTRMPFDWPKRFAARAQDWFMARPEACTPHSLGHPAHTFDRTTLTRLGAPTIGRGAFQRSETDRRGYVEPHIFLARVSDSFQHCIEPASVKLEADGLSVAMLEARLTITNPARLGEGFELMSAFSQLSGRTMTLAHHFFEAQSGTLLAHLEAISVFFDLTARRAISPPREVSEALQGRLIPALARPSV